MVACLSDKLGLELGLVADAVHVWPVAEHEWVSVWEGVDPQGIWGCGSNVAPLQSPFRHGDTLATREVLVNVVKSLAA